MLGNVGIIHKVPIFTSVLHQVLTFEELQSSHHVQKKTLDIFHKQLDGLSKWEYIIVNVTGVLEYNCTHKSNKTIHNNLIQHFNFVY